MSDASFGQTRVATERVPGVPNVANDRGSKIKANEFNPSVMFNRVWNWLWGARDYYKVFGWDQFITPQMMYRMYMRGGIARRIIEAYPDATWAYPPDMTGVSTKFDTAWNTMTEDLNLWAVFHKWDKLARLGRYAVLLIGTGDSNLKAPITKASKILYLQPYSEVSAQITRWETDASSPRFGQPMEYTIYPDLLEAETRPPTMSSWGFPTRRSFVVSATRCLHLAHGATEDEVFGTPQFVPIWNYLADLQKVVGGSAESYWLTANRGLQIDIDKDMELDAADEASLDKEVDEYADQQRRILRTRGTTIRDLGAKVADPRGPYTVILQLLSGACAIPTRILIGSEAGHLASTQDKSAWAQQIEAYRELTAYPKCVRPFILFCVTLGILPDPKAKLSPDWPDAYRASPLERAQTANQWSTAFMNTALGMSKVTNLVSVEEARAVLGAPSDNQIFIDDSIEVPATGTPPELAVPPANPNSVGPAGSKKTTPGGGNTAAPGSADSNGSGSASTGGSSSASGSGA